MTKILQFVGGFILSFLLIVGLFTGIFWYTKEPAPVVVDEESIADSLYALGEYEDSMNVHMKERIQLRRAKEALKTEGEQIEREKQALSQSKALEAEIRLKLDKAQAEEDSIMELRYEELARLIETMKPVDSGPLLDNLPDYTAAKVLTKMKKRQAGRVMNVMQNNKRVAVSQLITLLRQ